MRKISIALVAFLSFGCATTKEYVPVVDPSSISDETTYQTNFEECKTITDSIDYSDEEAIAALKGAGVGAGVVGTGAAVVAGTGGIVMASVALPIAAVAAGIGAATNASKTNANEQKMRAVVFNNCLRERGYNVLSHEDGVR